MPRLAPVMKIVLPFNVLMVVPGDESSVAERAPQYDQRGGWSMRKRCVCTRFNRRGAPFPATSYHYSVAHVTSRESCLACTIMRACRKAGANGPGSLAPARALGDPFADAAVSGGTPAPPIERNSPDHARFSAHVAPRSGVRRRLRAESDRHQGRPGPGPD